MINLHPKDRQSTVDMCPRIHLQSSQKPQNQIFAAPWVQILSYMDYYYSGFCCCFLFRIRKIIWSSRWRTTWPKGNSMECTAGPRPSQTSPIWACGQSRSRWRWVTSASVYLIYISSALRDLQTVVMQWFPLLLISIWNCWNLGGQALPWTPEELVDW